MNFATVYIREAHASDEWALRGSVQVQQPRTTAERVAIAKQFQAACNWRIPIWVDQPELNDPFEATFAPWPLRFYLVRPDRTFAYIATPVNETYDLVELSNRIDQMLTAM